MQKVLLHTPVMGVGKSAFGRISDNIARPTAKRMAVGLFSFQKLGIVGGTVDNTVNIHAFRKHLMFSDFLSF